MQPAVTVPTPPTPTPPPPDPNLAIEAQQSQVADQLAAQDTAKLDTASLMARYGTMLAMSGTPGSPLAARAGF